MAEKRKLTPEGLEKIRLNGFQEWIRKAKSIHGERFNYSRAKKSFERQKGPPLEVYCRKHRSWFSVVPFNHIRFKDGGCRRCDNETAVRNFRLKEGAKFLNWFEENCSDRLEIRSSFNGMTNAMKFFCRKHNSVSLHKPTDLLNSGAYGCAKCSREATTRSATLTLEKARQDLEMDFPDHVKILGVIFENERRRSLIHIECDFHGEQQVSKGTIKKSYYKCPRCGDASNGYSGNRLKNLVEKGLKGRPTYLGLMEVEVFGINSLKVGVTTRTLEDRYKWHLKKIIFSIQLSELDAYVLENQIHREFNKNHDLRILKAGMRKKERWAGDTECYWFNQKDSIIKFIKTYLRKRKSVNYQRELDVYEVPNFFPREVSREKSIANKPVAIVGIHPTTNQIIHEFPSLSEAIRAGYRNLSTVLYCKNNRRLAGGLRWFRKSEFDPNNLPPLPERRWRTTRVRCIETGKTYDSVRQAEKDLRSRGIPISASHISSVCSGKRKRAGGYNWEYVG